MACIKKEGSRMILWHSVKPQTGWFSKIAGATHFTMITGEYPAAKGSSATDCLFQNAGPRRCEQVPCFRISVLCEMLQKCACKAPRRAHFDVQLKLQFSFFDFGSRKQTFQHQNLPLSVM
jgi:hypothetical protein